MYTLLYKINDGTDWRIFAEYKTIFDMLALGKDSIELLRDGYTIRLEELTQ
jgi:hypothetical protein